MRFPGLVENEILKFARQRRFRVVVVILVALIGLIVFAQSRTRQRFLGGKDWHVETQERMARLQNGLRDNRTPDSMRRWAHFEVDRLQYHLDRDINPEAISGPLFVRGFANAASYLLLPLLAIVFASDVVSAEFAGGTIKLLLTRPVGRARVLASKLAALMLAITLTVLFGAAVAYVFGGLAYGYRGWEAPVLTGFRVAGDRLDPAVVRSIVLWKETILAYGLAWFAALCVGALALLTSVLLRSTAAAMGTMLAALIAGTILPRLAPSWEAQKFLFVTNLPLPDYYSGSPPPIPGLTVGFGAAVLAVWAAAALVAAFAVFVRRDVLA
jgi:ABC-2 type transport system permease protein